MQTAIERTDSDIVRDILACGQGGDFDILVCRHKASIFRLCLGFCGQREDAEDLTQDIFINAYLSLHTFKHDSQFSTWLYRIGINASLNKLRKRKLHTSPIQTTDYFIVSEYIQPDQKLIDEDLQRYIQQAIDQLPETQRTAFILSKFNDLSQKEIAEAMQTSESAIESLLHRAKQKLRQIISKKTNLI